MTKKENDERPTTTIPGIGKVSITNDGWIDKRKLKKPLREIVDKMKKEKDAKNIKEQQEALIKALQALQNQ